MGEVERLSEALKNLIRNGPENGGRRAARTLLAGADVVELSHAEQRLLDEGLDPGDLREVCALHLEVLDDRLKEVRARLAPGHVLDTMYREHDTILRYLDLLDAVNNRIQHQHAFQAGSKEYAVLRDVAEHLVAAEMHHAREDEVLFPELESLGLDGPPRIMRMEHADIRAHKARLLRLAVGAVAGPGDFAAFQEELAKIATYLGFHLRDHVYKENLVLYPAALEVIPTAAWPGIKAQCDNIGYCCFTPAR